MSQAGDPIKSAFLHQAITVPGAIQSERTLSQAKLPGIKMTWLPKGLEIIHKGITALVPLANVAVAVVDTKE